MLCFCPKSLDNYSETLRKLLSLQIENTLQSCTSVKQQGSSRGNTAAITWTFVPVIWIREDKFQSEYESGFSERKKSVTVNAGAVAAAAERLDQTVVSRFSCAVTIVVLPDLSLLFLWAEEKQSPEM